MVLKTEAPRAAIAGASSGLARRRVALLGTGEGDVDSGIVEIL